VLGWGRERVVLPQESRRLNEARETDVGSFAETLEQFGFFELSPIGTRAAYRRTSWISWTNLCKAPRLTKRTRTRRLKIIFERSGENIR
jgi:hypothetical protein